MPLPPDNRRRNPRFACNGPAEVLLTPDGPMLPARILNISAEGALIALQTPRILLPNARVELTFTVRHLLFRVRAEMRAARPGDEEFGFQFLSLSHRMLAQIEDVVQELAMEEGIHVPRLTPRSSSYLAKFLPRFFRIRELHAICTRRSCSAPFRR